MQAAQPGAQLSGAVDQRVELVERLGAGLVRAALHDLQRRNASTGPSWVFGVAGGLTGEHRAGRGDRVDDVGLAVAAADLPVRPRHLDHLDPGVGQVPGQRGPVAAGALDPDRVRRHRTHAATRSSRR